MKLRYPLAIQNLIYKGVPMAQSFGFEVNEVHDDRVLTRVVYREEMQRPGGTVSGPVIMSLADASMYAIILATLGPEEMAVTSNLNINFLQRPAPADLLAETRLLKIGRRLAFCEVTMLSEGGNGRPVAHATGSYALPG